MPPDLQRDLSHLHDPRGKAAAVRTHDDGAVQEYRPHVLLAVRAEDGLRSPVSEDVLAGVW